ncbi:uncharacterized protein LOC129598477 [Paramacrobiotus metropolitanus]|uniref:uncharacterized protein LOC129598477 n=1 Tax=Paramacrobiotus metropolitanus TaxID=2943436 RepID=UPI0024456B92|nr:uncharacterized protein LOC129598477 [Paramacrobiotus metropolitanus]
MRKLFSLCGILIILALNFDAALTLRCYETHSDDAAGQMRITTCRNAQAVCMKELGVTHDSKFYVERTCVHGWVGQLGCNSEPEHYGHVICICNTDLCNAAQRTRWRSYVGVVLVAVVTVGSTWLTLP